MQWRIVALLAWRNLWRNYRRSIIMLAAISVAVWAMIFMIALMRGMVDDMLAQGTQRLPGHIQIQHPRYRDDPSVDNSFVPNQQLLAELAALPVVAVSQRLQLPAVVSSERETRAVLVAGIEPVAEQALGFDIARVQHGRFIRAVDDNGIVIGLRLAERLETGLGKRIVLMSQTPGNDIADRGFRVVGIYRATMPSDEERLVYVGRATLQQLLRLDNQLSQIAIQTEDYRQLDHYLSPLRAAAGNTKVVLPWYDLDVYLGTMLSVMDGFVWVWIIVVFLALSFGLVNTLVMAVFERVREVGLMLALGMMPAAILGQFLLESLWLLAIGIVIGNGLALLTVLPLQSGIDVSMVAEGMAMMGAGSTLYPVLQSGDMLLVSVVVLLLGLLASVLPAWRAARLNPVQALNKH
jgi:ABC-type lipoprotein release transport system permease subunit